MVLVLGTPRIWNENREEKTYKNDDEILDDMYDIDTVTYMSCDNRNDYISILTNNGILKIYLLNTNSFLLIVKYDLNELNYIYNDDDVEGLVRNDYIIWQKDSKKLYILYKFKLFLIHIKYNNSENENNISIENNDNINKINEQLLHLPLPIWYEQSENENNINNNLINITLYENKNFIKNNQNLNYFSITNGRNQLSIISLCFEDISNTEPILKSFDWNGNLLWSCYIKTLFYTNYNINKNVFFGLDDDIEEKINNDQHIINASICYSESLHLICGIFTTINNNNNNNDNDNDNNNKKHYVFLFRKGKLNLSVLKIPETLFLSEPSRCSCSSTEPIIAIGYKNGDVGVFSVISLSENKISSNDRIGSFDFLRTRSNSGNLRGSPNINNDNINNIKNIDQNNDKSLTITDTILNFEYILPFSGTLERTNSFTSPRKDNNNNNENENNEHIIQYPKHNFFVHISLIHHLSLTPWSYSYSLTGPISSLEFSPCGSYISVSHAYQKGISIWNCLHGIRSFSTLPQVPQISNFERMDSYTDSPLITPIQTPPPSISNIANYLNSNENIFDDHHDNILKIEKLKIKKNKKNRFSLSILNKLSFTSNICWTNESKRIITNEMIYDKINLKYKSIYCDFDLFLPYKSTTAITPLYLYSHDTIGLLLPSIYSSSSLKWKSICLPPSISSSYLPIEEVVQSPSGRSIAIRCKKGLFIHHLETDKWRQFGVYENERLSKILGIIWWGEDKVILIIQQSNLHYIIGCWYIKSLGVGRGLTIDDYELPTGLRPRFIDHIIDYNKNEILLLIGDSHHQLIYKINIINDHNNINDDNINDINNNNNSFFSSLFGYNNNNNNNDNISNNNNNNNKEKKKNNEYIKLDLLYTINLPQLIPTTFLNEGILPPKTPYSSTNNSFSSPIIHLENIETKFSSTLSPRKIFLLPYFKPLSIAVLEISGRLLLINALNGEVNIIYDRDIIEIYNIPLPNKTPSLLQPCYLLRSSRGLITWMPTLDIYDSSFVFPIENDLYYGDQTEINNEKNNIKNSNMKTPEKNENNKKEKLNINTDNLHNDDEFLANSPIYSHLPLPSEDPSSLALSSDFLSSLSTNNIIRNENEIPKSENILLTPLRKKKKKKNKEFSKGLTSTPLPLSLYHDIESIHIGIHPYTLSMVLSYVLQRRDSWNKNQNEELYYDPSEIHTSLKPIISVIIMHLLLQHYITMISSNINIEKFLGKDPIEFNNNNNKSNHLKLAISLMNLLTPSNNNNNNNNEINNIKYLPENVIIETFETILRGCANFFHDEYLDKSLKNLDVIKDRHLLPQLFLSISLSFLQNYPETFLKALGNVCRKIEPKKILLFFPLPLPPYHTPSTLFYLALNKKDILAASHFLPLIGILQYANEKKNLINNNNIINNFDDIIAKKKITSYQLQMSQELIEHCLLNISLTSMEVVIQVLLFSFKIKDSINNRFEYNINNKKKNNNNNNNNNDNDNHINNHINNNHNNNQNNNPDGFIWGVGKAIVSGMTLGLLSFENNNNQINQIKINQDNKINDNKLEKNKLNIEEVMNDNCLESFITFIDNCIEDLDIYKLSILLYILQNDGGNETFRKILNSIEIYYANKNNNNDNNNSDNLLNDDKILSLFKYFCSFFNLTQKDIPNVKHNFILKVPIQSPLNNQPNVIREIKLSTYMILSGLLELSKLNNRTSNKILKLFVSHFLGIDCIEYLKELNINENFFNI